MPYSVPVPTDPSGRRLVDAILWGSQWDDPDRPVATRLATYIVGKDDVGESFIDGFPGELAMTNGAEMAAFRLAARLMAEVCNLRIEEVRSQAAADLLLGSVGDGGAAEEAYGVASPPDAGAGGRGAVIVNYDLYEGEGFAGLRRGGFDFQTVVHELGHALGLKHPHDTGGGGFPIFPGVTEEFDDLGAARLNQGLHTMMSYNSGAQGREVAGAGATWGLEGGPMALDIAALQYLYGANARHHAGDDAYVLPSRNGAGTFYSSLWDAGGTDRIVAGSDRDATIDLRAATLRVEAGGGGRLSAEAGVAGGYTIAAGVVIEDAAGRGGRDRLVGNDAANRLDGGAGADRLQGLGGADRLRGGAGDDRVEGGGGADRLDGGAGADRLSGGGGDDVLRLGAGDDACAGGDGRDEFRYAGGRDRIADLDARAERLLLDAGLSGDRSDAYLAGIAREGGGALVLDFGGGDVLRLAGVGLAGLLDAVAWDL